MAYHSGSRAPDLDEVPPDYDMDTIPGPGGRHAGRQQYPDREAQPHIAARANGRYPEHTSRSGQFRNAAFDPDDVAAGSGRHAHGETWSLDRSRAGRHEFTDLDTAERGGIYGRENQSFSFDEGDGTGTLRRRYSRKKKSRRLRSAKWGREGAGDDSDQDSVHTISPEALQRARDFLATIRIRRRTRRSLKREHSQTDDADDVSDDVYEEVVGLPSARILDKSKTLAERMQELKDQSNAEVAKSLRERYTDFDPSLVASAAWKGWEKKRSEVSDIWNQLDIWSSHFKEIEGRFGTATASYFRFTRWLVFLNFYTFLISFLVIVMPFFASPTPDHFSTAYPINQASSNTSVFEQQAVRCSALYEDAIDNFTNAESTGDKVLDFFLGTGWMETTSMFYGHYYNRTFDTAGSDYNYNMGLAYLLTIGFTFLISFFLILVNSSSSVKEAVISDRDQSSVHFTNSVMCGWDFCILDEKSAHSKHSILCQEFKADLLEQQKRLQRENRTYRDKVKLVIVRIVINFLVLCILGGAIFLIYFTTSRLLDLREKTSDQIYQLIFQLLPSLTITVLNFIIPELFNILVTLEDYWPAFQLKITLIRTVFLRLSSLGVLTITLYYTLLWPTDRQDFFCREENKTDSQCCGNYLWEGQNRLSSINDTSHSTDRSTSTVQCWETYIGQQFYKLAIVDFAALVLITIVEFIRKVAYNCLKDKMKMVEKYGPQEFDIPRNVLDIVYSQSLSWLGSFFAPLLPAMTLLKVFFIFYIKKLTLMRNFSPPQNVYKVSRSNSFFSFILLLSFVLVAVIIGYMVGNINPSKSCGPFRLYSKEDYVMWASLTDVISGWPTWASTIFFFFGTTTFFVPCFIVLCLLMYYYWAVGQGYKRRDEILQEQLKLEGKDKQFLLARVNDIIKQDNLQGITSGRS